MRQLLTESLVLAALGGAAGLLLAKWFASGMLPALEQGDVLDLPLALDWRAVGFTVGAGVIASLLSGVLPAIRAARIDTLAGVQEGARGHIGPPRRFGIAGALVSVQLSLSLILIAGAGLMVGTVRNLERIEPGFEMSNLLVFRVDPTLNGYEGERLRALYSSLLERMRALPGVTAATMSSYTLISGSAAISEVYTGSVSAGSRPSERRPLAWRLNVDDEFFKTMRLPLVAGRVFGPGESPSSQPVAIVNRAFVLAALQGDEPLGRRFKMSRRPGAPEFEIVGVAADARFSVLRDDAPPTVYLSTRQAAPGPMSFELRTTGDPLAIVESVRAAVNALEPNVPMFSVRTQVGHVQQSLRRERLFAQLATILGIVTLVLCAIGLYGLLTASVSQRVPEIGVRMALGAAAGDVRWMILRQSWMLVVAGLAVGIPAAWFSGRMLESMLFGVAGSEQRILVLAATILGLVATMAAWIPARRASRVDPVVALRN